MLLAGILWVARTDSSWREMPEEYGKWETAYRRYELWLGQDLCGASSSRYERRVYQGR